MSCQGARLRHVLHKRTRDICHRFKHIHEVTFKPYFLPSISVVTYGPPYATCRADGAGRSSTLPTAICVVSLPAAGFPGRQCATGRQLGLFRSTSHSKHVGETSRPQTCLIASSPPARYCCLFAAAVSRFLCQQGLY